MHRLIQHGKEALWQWQSILFIDAKVTRLQRKVCLMGPGTGTSTPMVEVGLFMMAKLPSRYAHRPPLKERTTDDCSQIKPRLG